MNDFSLSKKPYELSVWEDELVTSNGTSYYQESLLAVIGSDTLDTPNKCFNTKLNKNVNGEVELTFSLQYKVYSDEVDDYIVNPFTLLLINERKIKLKYDNQWYDFIIKEIEEESEENVFNYTAKDLFINELSKEGYDVELSAELGNHQGNVTQLAERIMESTNWQVVPPGTNPDDSDYIRQYLEEPLYEGKLNTTINCVEAISLTSKTVNSGEVVYFFYSTIANEQTSNVHIILKSEESSFIYTDNNVIKANNYRISGNISYDSNKCPNIVNPASFKNVTEYQGYRLVYSVINRYDPVTERTVDLFKVRNSDKEIYHYKQADYTTSDVVYNFMTNNNNFSINQGNITGWSHITSISTTTDSGKVEIASYPAITTDTLPDLKTVNALRGFLRLHFNGTISNNRNTIYNAGIFSGSGQLGVLTKGQKYGFRVKYGITGSGGGKPLPDNGKSLRLKVAGYEFINGRYALTNKIYLDFDGAAVVKNNEINDGYFIEQSGKKVTYIRNTEYGTEVVTPSKDYYYRQYNANTYYKWDAVKEEYVLKDSNDLNHYLYTAICQLPLTVDQLKREKVGIFLYTTSGAAANYYYWLEDVELFKYIEDGNNEPILIGNAPTAKAIETDYYYLKDTSKLNKEEVETFSTLSALANYLNISVNDIYQIYNTDCEKFTSIEVSKSNYFNNIQELCEKFECWAKFSVQRNEDGSLKLDSNHNPIKRISFHEFVGKENFSGFKYGINLEKISRTVESTEIVTKLIVPQKSSDYTDSGSLAIRLATSNPLGESYILNFSYYLNKGLIKRSDFETDYSKFQREMKEYNLRINEKSQEYSILRDKLIKIGADYSVYENTILQSNKDLQEALDAIKKITGKDYASLNMSTLNSEAKKAIVDPVGQIVELKNIISTYNGLASQLKKEYTSLSLQVDGAKEYIITISTTNNCTRVIIDSKNSDYTADFSFTLISGSNTYNCPQETGNYLKVYEWGYVANAFSFSNTGLPSGYRLLDSNRNVLSGTVSLAANSTRVFYLSPGESFIAAHPGLKKEIEKLENEKKVIEKNFTNKYKSFVQEGTWDSDDYVDNELYYNDALQVSNTSAKPKVSYSFNALEISELEGFENYNFDVGDKTYVEDTEFFGWKMVNGLYTPVSEEVIISEVTWNLDDPTDNSITVQNYKTQFEDLFQRISASVIQAEYRAPTYAKVAGMLDEQGNINTNVLVQSLGQITNSALKLSPTGIVTIETDGISVKDQTNRGNIIKLSSEGLKVSVDGGTTWRVVLNAKGIDINYLKAGSIDVSKISIMDGDQTSFRWDKQGLNAYYFDNSDNEYNFNKFVRMDRFGVYGYDGDFSFSPRNIDDIKNQAQFGLTWDGFFIKSSYPNGYVSISSDDDFQVIQKINGNDVERIKIGALAFDPLSGIPTLYGININDNNGNPVIQTNSDGDLTITGTIEASAGHIGGMSVDSNKLSMRTIVLEPGNGIYSTNTINGEPIFKISDIDGSASFNNAAIRGAITAETGDFLGAVYVGDRNSTNGFIEINGGYNTQEEAFNSQPIIKSGNYTGGANRGWMINADGDAAFNNIAVRGSIKTAVFEYGEIEAVGGAFLFRPSSRIKSVERSGSDLVVTVERPQIFRKNSWCKLSNYGQSASASESSSTGLVHVYKIKEINGDKITLEGASDGVIDISNLSGGVLIDFGFDKDSYVIEVLEPGDDPSSKGLYEYNEDEQIYELTSDTTVIEGKDYYKNCYEKGIHNYGIGINSSDNYVNLPQRSISLFETDVRPNESPKVKYIYKGIVGTLPTLGEGEGGIVNPLYNRYMAGTQGIYTDNAYIGNKEQYMSFYSINGNKRLEITTPNLVVNENGAYIEGEVRATSGYISGNVTIGAGADASTLSNIDNTVKNINSHVIIDNKSIMLGDPKGFHIYIDSDKGYNGEGRINAKTKTYGLGFYQKSHNKEYEKLEYIPNIDRVDSDTIYYLGEETSPGVITIDGQCMWLQDGDLLPDPSDERLQGKELYVEKDARIAYINDERLSIPYTVVLKGMELGQEWIWELNDDTKNLTLKWQGEE